MLLRLLTPAYAALLTRVSDGRYPVRDGVVAFAEFTAVYPVGSVAQYTTWRGRQIPLYPTPGRRAIKKDGWSPARRGRLRPRAAGSR